MGLTVQGNTPGCVSFGVCAQLGYDTSSARGRRASGITEHVLAWWKNNSQMGWTQSWNEDTQKRFATRYVKQEYGMIWGFIFSWLISAVVNYVIDWLNSPESAAYREANG